MKVLNVERKNLNGPKKSGNLLLSYLIFTLDRIRSLNCKMKTWALAQILPVIFWPDKHVKTRPTQPPPQPLMPFSNLYDQIYRRYWSRRSTPAAASKGSNPLEIAHGSWSSTIFASGGSVHIWWCIDWSCF